MERKVAFGLALRRLRLARGLSQEAVASSQAYVSEVEAGKKSPSIDAIERFAASLRVHPVTLLAFSHLLEGEDSTVLMERVATELEQFRAQ